MSLGVVNGNPARRLYERFGFVAVERGRGCRQCVDDACMNCMICSFFGMAHGECGGVMMEKPLT